MTTQTAQDSPVPSALPNLDAWGWTEVHDLLPTLEKVRPFTIISDAWLTDLARLVHTVLTYNIPGDFVECGVWRGGAAFLMADLLRQAGVNNRKVWLCDSFEGLPPPAEIDGPNATRYATNTSDPYYYDNCRASLDDVQDIARQLQLTDHVQFVKGWFDQTLPARRAKIGPIAILRLDCDWHASVRCCLDTLYGQVVEGGIVGLDDYFHVDGCALALHEFFGEHHLAHRIESASGSMAGIERVSGAWPAIESYAETYQGALFRKGGDATWFDLRHRYMAAQDIAALVPPGSTFILIDHGWLGDHTPGGRHAVPLSGPTRQHSRVSDGATLQAVQQKREAGATFLVFAWPAFWWIDHNSALGHELHAKYRSLLENQRVTVFDLR